MNYKIYTKLWWQPAFDFCSIYKLEDLQEIIMKTSFWLTSLEHGLTDLCVSGIKDN